MHKQQWKKNGTSSRQFKLGSWTWSRARKRLFCKHRKHEQSPLCIIDGLLKERPNWKQNSRSTDVGSYSVETLFEDDAGAYAVFTAKGSSASQITAAKVMNVIERLPDRDGQAADAVSAFTQVKMGDASKLLRFPRSECTDLWIRIPQHRWTKSYQTLRTQEFHSNETCTDIHWQAYSWKKVGIFFGTGMGGGAQLGDAYLFRDNQVYSSLCTWMTLKWQARSITWLPYRRNQ